MNARSRNSRRSTPPYASFPEAGEIPAPMLHAPAFYPIHSAQHAGTSRPRLKLISRKFAFKDAGAARRQQSLMAPAPSPPPTRGSGVEDARRKLLLDDLVAGPEVLAQPVLHVDPVTLDSIPSNRGKRRIEDVEEAVGRNLRSAEEARRALQAEHKRLEAEAGIRRKLEREVGSLRRDIERTQESERLRVAQARYTAEREARKEVLAEVEAVSEEHNRALERDRSATDGARQRPGADVRVLGPAARRAAGEGEGPGRRGRGDGRAARRPSSGSRRSPRPPGAGPTRSCNGSPSPRPRSATRSPNATSSRTRSSWRPRTGRGRDLTQTVADLENLVAELEANLTAERARTDNAIAHAAELTEELDAAPGAKPGEPPIARPDGAARSGARRRGGRARRRHRPGARARRGAGAAAASSSTSCAPRRTTSTRRSRSSGSSSRRRRGERDALAQEVAKLTELVEAANAKTASNDKVRELERLLDIAEAEHDSLMQEVSDLRVELAERTARVQSRHRRRRRTTKRSRRHAPHATRSRSRSRNSSAASRRRWSGAMSRSTRSANSSAPCRRSSCASVKPRRSCGGSTRRLPSTCTPVATGRAEPESAAAAPPPARRADTSTNAARPGGGAGAGRGRRAGRTSPGRRSRRSRRRSNVVPRWPSSRDSRRSNRPTDIAVADRLGRGCGPAEAGPQRGTNLRFPLPRAAEVVGHVEDGRIVDHRLLVEGCGPPRHSRCRACCRGRRTVGTDTRCPLRRRCSTRPPRPASEWSHLRSRRAHRHRRAQRAA